MFLSVEDVSAIYPDENNKESDTCIILVNLKNTNNAEQKMTRAHKKVFWTRGQRSPLQIDRYHNQIYPFAYEKII
jgi:hypothetical protein